MERKPSNIAIIALLLILMMLVYGIWIEPQRITVKHVIIHDPELYAEWGNVRIAQISDLHITREGGHERRVLDELGRLKPDIIVITGDMAQWDAQPQGAIHFIKQLHAPEGVYCVMGDADYSSRRNHCLFCHPSGNVHRLRKSPVILRNTVIKTKLKNGGSMLIAGVTPGGDWGGDDDFLQEILGQHGHAILVLSHFSQEWSGLVTKRPVLWLSGDTHGGQVLLPSSFWQMVRIKPDPVHMAGLFRGGLHKWLYVNSGIGMTKNLPLRIGVPPEITLITFQGQEQ